MSGLRDSGVYWLGSIARDWSVVPAWRVMKERKEKSRDSDVHLTPSQAYGVVAQQEFMETTGNRVVLNLAGADNMKHVEEGDFIIHLRSFQGGIEASPLVGKVSNAYTVLVPQSDADYGYFRWFMKSAPLIEGLASSTDQLRDGQSINFSRFSRLSLPLPPLETQRRIAEYLDRETAEIDAAVADLDKYVELLEKRKWTKLTEIFESYDHSNVRLSVASNMKTGTTPSNLSESTEGVPWLKPEGLSEQSTGQRVSRETLSASLLSPPGTTFVCGIGATVGKVGYSTETSITNQQITALTPTVDIIPKLFYYSVLTLTQRFRKTAPGSTLPILNNSRMGAYSIPIPGSEVQHVVLNEIEELFRKTGDLITESTKLRELLLKRRSVLISDVVTGRKQV